MNVYQILVKARDIFAEQGGAKGVLEDCDSKVCAVGALNMAEHGTAGWAANFNMEISVLNARYELDKHTPGGYIVDYNNQKLVTFDDVLAVFDKAIAGLEEKV